MTKKDLDAKYSNLAALLGDIQYKIIRLELERAKVVEALQKLQTVAEQIAAEPPPNAQEKPQA